jgi:AsmA protein
MRAAKWIVIVLLALAALLAAGAFALTQLVDPNRFKDDIEHSVSSATGRKFTLSGDIELDFFPWLALQTAQGSLGNPPGFAGEPLLSWGEARIAARLLPLIRGDLVVDRIQLRGAKVSLVRMPDGRANWDGFGERRGATADATNSTFDVAGIELLESSLRYVDRGSGFEVALDRWQLTTTAIRAGKPLDVETSFVASARGSDAAADLSVKTRYLAGETAKFEDTQLRGAVSGAAIAAQQLPVQFGAPLMEISIATSRLRLDDWTAKLGMFSANGSASGSWGEESGWTGRLALDTPQLRAALAQLRMQAPATRDGAAFGEFSLATEFKIDSTGIAARPLTTKLDDTTLSGELTVGAPAPRLIEFTLDGDRIDLARYLEPEDAVSEPFVFPTAALRALRARGTLRLAEATLADTKLKGVRIGLVMDERGARADAPKR